MEPLTWLEKIWANITYQFWFRCQCRATHDVYGANWPCQKIFFHSGAHVDASGEKFHDP